MDRSRSRLLPALCAALLAAACAEDEFAPPTPGGEPPAGAAPAQAAAPPSFADGELQQIRALPGVAADAEPALQVFAWSREGLALADMDADVYWQTDQGPSLTTVRTGPEGWTHNLFPSGALIHRLLIRPTATSAPHWVQVGQYMQPGRIVRVDALILRAAMIRGVVLDEAGAPIPGATVAGFQRPLTAVDPEEKPAADNFGAADENGAFLLGGFGPGPFVLEAAAEGRVNTWRLTGTLEEGELVEGVELPMEPAHAVHGQALDPDGAPVRGARVIAGRGGRRQTTQPGPKESIVYVPARQTVTASDDSGVFTLPLVPDSQQWNLNVDHPRFRKHVGRLEAGQVDVIVRLERGLEVRGSVLDAGGGALANAAVVLLGAKPSVAQSNRRGVFVLGGLDEEAGRFLYVSHAGWAPRLLGPMDPASGEEVAIRLEERAPLAGRLVGADGAPIAGARLTLHFLDLPPGFPDQHYPPDLRSLQSGLSGPDGGFSFDGLPGGRYRVEADAGDGRAGAFELRTGEAARDLALERP